MQFIPFSRLAPKPAHQVQRGSVFLVGLLLLVATVCESSAQTAFTLEEAMTYAESHAPAPRLARADLAEAEGQIKETTSIGIPKVNATASYTYFTEIPAQLLPDFITPAIYGVLAGEQVQGSNGAIQVPAASNSFTPVQFGQKNSFQLGGTANFLLFDATFFIALKGARLYRNLAIRNVEQAAYLTHSQVSRAYLATLIAQRNLSTIDRNLANLEQSLKETNAIYEAGFAEKLSVDRLRLTLSNLQAQRETLTQVEQISKNLLKFQMGYPVTEEISLATPLDEALGEARVVDLILDADFDVRVRPEYATLQVADSLNLIDLRRIKAGYYPSLSGIGSLSRQLQRNNLFDANQAAWIPSSYVGVTLNVPIYDGGLKKAQRQRALARVDKTRVQIDQFTQGARLALANARAVVSLSLIHI